MAIRLTRTHQFVLAAVLAAATAIAAEPSSFSYVPSSTGILIGINLEGLKASKVGQMLFAKIEEQAKADPKMGATALNAVNSIRELVVAVEPGPGDKTKALVLVSGKFDSALIQSLAQLGGLKQSVVGGVTMFSNDPAKKQDPFSGALVSDSLIVAGEPSIVTASLASRGTSRPDPVWAAKASALGASHHIWLLTTAPFSELTKNVPQAQMEGPQAELLKSVQQISGGLTFGPKLLLGIDILTTSEKDAMGMAEALKMLLALASSSDQGKKAAPILQNLSLTSEAATMKIGLAIAEEDLMKMFQSAVQPKPSEPTVQAPVSESKPPSSGGNSSVVTLPPPK